jgi:tetratricopeptide (TPR) repeat protein
LVAAELSDAIHAQVQALSAEGDAHADRGEHDAALAKYATALRLLPEPWQQWEAATWLLAAVGDTHFAAKRFDAARNALSDAMHCPGAIGNPFIHFRLGQSAFELGELDQAADELMRAYMGAGEEIFGSDDPKYLAFLKTRAKID